MNEMKDIDFEQELYNHFGQVKDFTLGMRIGKYFYELGKQSGSSETPKNLEEAAKKEYPCDKSWMTPDMLDLNAHKQVAFRKGAEWQKEQDTRDMYMSDNRHFQKIYELGRKEEREEMMKEVVEGEVVKDINNKLAVTAKNVNLDGFKFGDKVRIIICKKEDEK